MRGFGVSKDDLGGNKNKVRVPLNLCEPGEHIEMEVRQFENARGR